jgi:hypothetical protein
MYSLALNSYPLARETDSMEANVAVGAANLKAHYCPVGRNAKL